MKTIVDKDTNISLYLLEDDKALNVTATNIEIGDPIEINILDYNGTNTTVHENVTPPDDWNGRKYIFDGADWTLNEDYEEPRSEELGNLREWEIPPLTDEKRLQHIAYYKDKRDNFS
jgi:hypothetical protein